MADYQYDAFISYRRTYRRSDGQPPENTHVNAWVHQFFADSFRGFFVEALGGEATVFFDRDSIEVGSTWPDRLSEAVRTSRCLVPILTPTYFKSPWCCWEWGSFAERARAIGGKRELIAPVGLHDGEWFPSEVKAFQEQDFRNFFVTARAFRDSPLFIDFENAMRRLATRVAAMARRVPPPPAEGWPVAEAPYLEPPPIAQPRLRVA